MGSRSGWFWRCVVVGGGGVIIGYSVVTVRNMVCFMLFLFSCCILKLLSIADSGVDKLVFLFAAFVGIIRLSKYVNMTTIWW